MPTRIRLIRYVISGFLILSLIMLIVLACLLPAYIDSIVNEKIKHAESASDIDSIKQYGEMAKKSITGFVIILIIVEMFFVWGVFIEVLCPVLMFAILGTLGLIFSAAYWPATAVFTVAFIINLVLTLLSYYTAYFLITKSRTEISSPPFTPITLNLC